MAQDERSTTAIRELMSRGQPPKSTNLVRAAHAELVAALAGNAPHPIYAEVEPDDLETRANHLEKLFAALHDYLTVVIADTAQNIPGGTLDRRCLDQFFHTFSAAALPAIRHAAQRMREHDNLRAS